MYAVETNSLTKSFKGLKAVDNLSLKVPEGSIYGFLGPNGAGKTTTIKMLTGLSKPTTGEIKICGKNVKFGSLKNRSDIGYLPDVPSFYDWMRPMEFLTFSGELFGIEKKVLNERAQSLMELVGLSGVKKKIGGFSRGMKQRLGIAQALISEPKVVFLDEPTSALDPIGRKDVMDIISKLSGIVTVFFSTHILADIERVCDTIVILDKGKAIIEDSISDLRQKYTGRTISIKLEENNGKKAEFENALREQEWLKKLNVNDNGDMIITAKDMKKAQLSIPGIIFEKGVHLREFAVLEPTLEDIFMKVVND